MYCIIITSAKVSVYNILFYDIMNFKVYVRYFYNNLVLCVILRN